MRANGISAAVVLMLHGFWGGGSGNNTKELTISNPEATLNNLRTVIAINFRLPLGSFRLQHATFDLNDDKRLLRNIGIQDGDTITVVAKHEREESGSGSGKSKENGSAVPPPPTTAGTMEGNSEAVTGVEKSGTEEADGDEESEFDENDGSDGSDDDDDDDDGQEAMLARLFEVPNLIEMRQRFLADPEGVLRQISADDPVLLELIAKNRQAFLDLVCNDNFFEELQRDREEGVMTTEEDEEFDEEMLEEVMSQFLAAASDLDDEAVVEQQDEDGSETQRYLDRVPTEVEEEKIEQLMQLGFTREQCKVAFFKAKRSIERAANLLFENPPQL